MQNLESRSESLEKKQEQTLNLNDDITAESVDEALAKSGFSLDDEDGNGNGPASKGGSSETKSNKPISAPEIKSDKPVTTLETKEKKIINPRDLVFNLLGSVDYSATLMSLKNNITPDIKKNAMNILEKMSSTFDRTGFVELNLLDKIPRNKDGLLNYTEKINTFRKSKNAPEIPFDTVYRANRLLTGLERQRLLKGETAGLDKDNLNALDRV
ncbi:MAG TPA: hypothetical protein PKC14_03720, partial [Candidatus Absconditabacterales bacterium]|nr:hypothetical protein [Candidatus Absconditabacterales bacterium]